MALWSHAPFKWLQSAEVVTQLSSCSRVPAHICWNPSPAECICFGGSSADTHCHFRYPAWSSHDRPLRMFQSKHCYISVSHLLIVLSAGPPPFGSSWVKRYCTFVKEQKILHMLTFDHRSGGKNVSCVQSSQTYIAMILKFVSLVCF